MTFEATFFKFITDTRVKEMSCTLFLNGFELGFVA